MCGDRRLCPAIHTLLEWNNQCCGKWYPPFVDIRDSIHTLLFGFEYFFDEYVTREAKWHHQCITWKANVVRFQVGILFKHTNHMNLQAFQKFTCTLGENSSQWISLPYVWVYLSCCSGNAISHRCWKMCGTKDRLQSQQLDVTLQVQKPFFSLFCVLRRCSYENFYIQVSKFPSTAHNQFDLGSIFGAVKLCPCDKSKCVVSKFRTPKFPF